MPLCIGSRIKIHFMTELIHEVYASSKPETPESQRHVSPPTVVASERIIRHAPSVINGLALAVWHIGHISETIFGRNNSLLGCLHLELAYRYHFVWKKRKNEPRCIWWYSNNLCSCKRLNYNHVTYHIQRNVHSFMYPVLEIYWTLAFAQ